MESETSEQREERRAGTGASSGETYLATLRSIAPNAECSLARLEDGGEGKFSSDRLAAYDAVFLTGAPLHVYQDTPEVRLQLAFMRSVFASGTPSFGSCAGLQIAVAAAGGKVRKRHGGPEMPFARRIVATARGRTHPLLAGRPEAWDALSIHADEVAHLPEEAILLASNSTSTVQAAEIRYLKGVFWGVQYHPELILSEVASALRRGIASLIRVGLAIDSASVEKYAQHLDALCAEPDRRDLAWQLGIDQQVVDVRLRQIELRNFIEYLVIPMMKLRLKI